MGVGVIGVYQWAIQWASQRENEEHPLHHTVADVVAKSSPWRVLLVIHVDLDDEAAAGRVLTKMLIKAGKLGAVAEAVLDLGHTS